MKILKYADIWIFSKFVSLLDTKKLFFPSVEQLSKSDPFEGQIPKNFPKIQGDDIWNKEFRNDVCINSWHMNYGESDAMWKLYLKNENGIAIQSTYKRLTESFNDSQNEIYIGKVKYIDYDKWKIPENSKLNAFIPFILKRESFEHEKELRALTSRSGLINFGVKMVNKMEYEYLLKDFKKKLSGLIINILEKTEIDVEKKANEIKEIATKLLNAKGIKYSNIELLLNILMQPETNQDNIDEGGVYIPVDPNILIEKIIVSPGAKPWFNKMVESILDKYELNKEIYNSILAKNPHEGAEVVA